MYTGLHVKCPLLLSHFNETFNFLDRFPKNTEISNFMKIRLVGGDLFHADGQTHMMKLLRLKKTRNITRSNFIEIISGNTSI
jgi:hypothetical protein